MAINWDKTFSEAKQCGGLAIQNTNPCPAQGGRNIFKDDKSDIMRAAEAHEFRIVSAPNAKVVSFVRNKSLC